MHTNPRALNWELGSDLPLTSPIDDAYGYAPFASRLATAIVTNKSPQGLVLAVHGKWGSGKSSLLNFIKHYLNDLPEAQRPVLIDFNPWWFEGREQIATQLLEQFSSQLPDRLKHLREVAQLVGKYSKQIADTAADLSGFAWIKKPLAFVLGWFPGTKWMTKKTSIPSVKKEVMEALKKSGKRYVFFVDDIDRLTPDEARDFFRAVKALADFPEVVYVLFFDREEVANALTASLRMNGEAYLEKIIQAPFHLPAVDQELLQKKLFEGLDAIIDANPTTLAFDQTRWVEVFSEGLVHCLKKPRDIVRILNAISVSYPPVAGEVNPVDFIALEFLRVFEPLAYETVRDAKEFFTGSPSQQDYKKAEDKIYFEKWKNTLPDDSRGHLISIIGRLFPRAAQALGDTYILSDDFSTWRRELRPCSTDCFSVYFQFGVPPGHVSRAELERLISHPSVKGMTDLLLDATKIHFPDGHSKARDLIDRLRDFDHLDPEQASPLIETLVSSAHLLLRKEDERGGFFSIPNRWRLSGLISKLLERIPLPERQQLLIRLGQNSPGLWGLVDLANNILTAKSDASKAPKAMLDLEAQFSIDFSMMIGKRLNDANLSELLAMPELDFIVTRWNEWGNVDCIQRTFKPMLDDDEKLLALIDKFVRTGLKQEGRITTETYQLSMKPLSIAVDVIEVEPRVRALQSRSDLSIRQRTAIKRFIQGMELISEGKNPDDFFHRDDD